MKEKKTSGYVGSVIANLVMLEFVNTIPLWRHLTRNVILASWTDVLWALNLAIGVAILGNLLLAYYRPARLQFFFGMLFSATNILSASVLYRVFPLNFSQIVGDWLNTLVKALFIVGIVGASIAFVVYLVRFIAGDRHTVSPTREGVDGGRV